MSRILIPVRIPDRATGADGGGTQVAGDATYGHVVQNDWRTVLVATNTDAGASHTVSFDVPSVLGDTEDGLNVQAPDRVVTLTALQRKIMGPFPAQWDQEQEHLANANLDTWTTGTDLASWNESITAGTVAREQAKVASPGGSAAKITRTVASGSLAIVQNTIHLLDSTKYRLRMAWAADQDGLGLVCGIKVFNQAQTNRLQPDGSWAAGDAYAGKWTPRVDYQEVELPITTPVTTGADLYTLELWHVTPGPLAAIYVDNVSLARWDGLRGVVFTVDSALLNLQAFRMG